MEGGLFLSPGLPLRGDLQSKEGSGTGEGLAWHRTYQGEFRNLRKGEHKYTNEDNERELWNLIRFH